MVKSNLHYNIIMEQGQRLYLSDCAKWYKEELSNRIMPFWIGKGLDREYGGVYTCLDRDGTLMDKTKSPSARWCLCC